MKKAEYDKLKGDLFYHIERKGMPIDVRTGANLDAACWVLNLIDKFAEIDTPLGTKAGPDFNMCPKCGGIIGISAYYCKRCGAYIRETEDEKREPF